MNFTVLRVYLHISMVFFSLNLYHCECMAVLHLYGQDDDDRMSGNLCCCGNMSLHHTLAVAGKHASNLHPRNGKVSHDIDNV